MNSQIVKRGAYVTQIASMVSTQSNTFEQFILSSSILDFDFIQINFRHYSNVTNCGLFSSIEAIGHTSATNRMMLAASFFSTYAEMYFVDETHVMLKITELTNNAKVTIEGIKLY